MDLAFLGGRTELVSISVTNVMTVGFRFRLRGNGSSVCWTGVGTEVTVVFELPELDLGIVVSRLTFWMEKCNRRVWRFIRVAVSIFEASSEDGVGFGLKRLKRIERTLCISVPKTSKPCQCVNAVETHQRESD